MGIITLLHMRPGGYDLRHANRRQAIARRRPGIWAAIRALLPRIDVR